MISRKFTLATVAMGVALTACATAFALSHPNFQGADEDIQAALGRINNAQQVNGQNFGGHAARAAQLLQQARQELRIADEYHSGIRR